jgi:uncharacterized protein (TIGR02145 family)
MSGIFKGDSIYKSGGGGGGFKDGGQLVDGDFIAVNNNTISTYDNETRDPVNFYFDVKPGEVVNSVIEFTTQVNATINVYVVNSAGELVPIGNIGGNTATAGESYNITVVGNSFMLENVVEPIAPDEPAAIIIDGSMYETKKLGNRIWTMDGIGINLSDSRQNTYNRPNNRFYKWGSVAELNNMLSGGWRVANENDWNDLRLNSGYTTAQLKSVDGWKMNGSKGPFPGTNESKMNFYPYGILTPSIYQNGWNCFNWCSSGPNSVYVIGCDSYGHKQQFFNYSTTNCLANIRLCKTV